MTEQIVFGRVECRKCGRFLEMYASSPGIMRRQFDRIAELLETHWADDCKMPADPEAYFQTTTPMTDEKDEANG